MLPVGSPAIGKDFINREHEINAIIDSLEKNNILLIGPRRYGKTSIMKRILTILSEEKGENIPAIFIDIHDTSTPQEFLIELATGAFDMARDKESFIKKMDSYFPGMLKDLEEFRISLGELKVKFKRSLKEEIEKSDWKEKGRILFTFIRNYFSNTVYFIIDEFSECVHNMSKESDMEVETFLKWFRSVRMEESNLRFFISGSVSIRRVMKNLSPTLTINDFKRIIIDGFDKETALYTVKKVFKEEGWIYTDKIGEKIIECIGIPSVPYFLSVFLSIIQEKSLGKGLDEKYIEKIYNNQLMGAYGKYYFAYYVQRLKIYYDDKEERAAKAILKELCQTGEISKGFAFDIFKRITNKDDYEWFTDLINDLSNDFYLKQIEDKIIFYSKPLVDWWRLYYV